MLEVVVIMVGEGLYLNNCIGLMIMGKGRGAVRWRWVKGSARGQGKERPGGTRWLMW